MRPADVKPKHELKIWMRAQQIPERARKEPVKEGDLVRLSKAKTIFDKGYLPNWTEELFKVEGHLLRPKKVYKLKDMKDEAVKGTFYKHDIQEVPEDPTYLIEKKLRKRTVGDRTEVLVKWQGWPAKFNSWLPESEITNYGQ